MELRQLTYFEAVARCGGFTAAARDLRVAQPAISAQVRGLERDLGVALLTRTSRRVALTEAGTLLLGRARRVLDELDAARGEMDAVAAVLRGRVVVGATGALGGLDLPGTLAGVARRYPGVRLSVRAGLMAPLLTGLGTGELDLVLGPIHDDLPAAYVADRLLADRVVLITPPGGPARPDPVALADLRDEPFVCLPAPSGLRALLAGAAAAAGFTPDVRFEAPAPDDVRAMVGAGLGVALFPASSLDGAGSPVEVHTLDPALPHPPFGVVCRRDRPLSPAAAAVHRRLLAAV